MARINYKMMYEALVDWIKKQEKYHADREYHFASEDVWDTGRFMHQSKKEQCEDLLCFVAGMENAWAEHLGSELLDANGMVSLHLYKSYDRSTCILDLSCPEGEQPERVYHEVMQTIGGLHDSGVTVSVDKHMYEVRYNGEFGVPLDKVRVASDQYVWVNDEGQEVDGPDVIFCYYYDTALSARPVA